MSNESTAAFFRAEGVLYSRGVVHAATWMAAQRAGLRERTLRFGQAVLAAPVFGLLGQNDRSLANRVAHLAYRDMTEDRIHVLAEEYVEDMLEEHVLDSGLELIKKARAEGHRIVVLSENIIEIMERAVDKFLRGDVELHCNRLEYAREKGTIKATGKLVEPIVGGHDGGRWVQEYAARNGVDLSRSIAYAGHGPDLLLLSAVGQPCVVNPDFTLRKAAREAEWPVVDYSA